MPPVLKVAVSALIFILMIATVATVWPLIIDKVFGLSEVFGDREGQPPIKRIAATFGQNLILGACVLGLISFEIVCIFAVRFVWLG
jgi:hypothetical protein